MIPLKPSIHDLQAEIRRLKKKLVGRDLILRRAVEVLSRIPVDGYSNKFTLDTFWMANKIIADIEQALKK